MQNLVNQYFPNDESMMSQNHLKYKLDQWIFM